MATSSTPTGLPDIYTPSAQLLTLIGLGNRALFSRKEDPLPQALHALTEYDMAAVDRVSAVKDSAGLYALLETEPETFTDHLLLGQLVYASPLGPCIAAMLAPDGSADEATLAQRRAELPAYVLHHAEWNSNLFENYLLSRHYEADRAEVQQERAELKKALEAAFAEWQHSLGALGMPAPPPVMPLAGTGWSLHPMQIQLDMLVVATTVLRALPALSSHPFAQAVQRLPDFNSQRLEELTDYLKAAEAEERLRLTRAQGLLLYVAAHLVMMLFVHDVLDAGGLDDFLLQEHRLTDDIEDLPEKISDMREAAAIMLSGYIEVVRENEGDAADFQALEARLQPVLALASQ
ncbi:hypothetical protein Q5H93_07880 [Hymenobacter sp. ASUV-10]|uniref:DUF1186 domain-containing protein n=1 Tax=Hymenobacter aranciens TaxID=3063996 RepID=A0ABT9BDQ7_9BACT|nr:hypothetical protein [Hymenobacter sp. ASUV-10]MDO7874648.1 hypothetical protein [Hymenobacter sp. ASUV-10]